MDTFATEFEVDFEYNGRKILVEGDVTWYIENDSFDYAGTHCTGGKGGTEHLPDYLELASISVNKITGFDDKWEKPEELDIQTPHLNQAIEREVEAVEKKYRYALAEMKKQREEDEVEFQLSQRGF